jgi:preprotein translocase subunit Sec61beta
MSERDKNEIKVDPATVVLIVSILLLLPLLFAGFFWQ